MMLAGRRVTAVLGPTTVIDRALLHLAALVSYCPDMHLPQLPSMHGVSPWQLSPQPPQLL